MRQPAGLIALLLTAACGDAGQLPAYARDSLLVAAAASLGDALPPLLEEFQREHGVTVRAVLGGSQELAGQLRAGASFDLLLLAGDGLMDELAAAGAIDAATRRDLVANRLVLAVPAGAPLPQPTDLADALRLLHGRRVAIGAPRVPAGDYARRWLARALADSTGVELVALEHVRAVLAAVEGRSVDAGFVYATDLVGRPGLRALLAAAPADTGPILYPAAVAAHAAHPELAARLLQFLADRRPAFLEAGFLPPGA